MTSVGGEGDRSRREADEVRVRHCGDSAICVEFGNRVDAGIHSRVIALDEAVSAQDLPGVVETVPTYRSLLIHVDPVQADHRHLARTLSEMATQPVLQREQAPRWRIPVLYGGSHGVDLESLAAERGMTPGEFAGLHAETVYRVFMVGFVPGFTYLGGLNPRLAAPRRPEPRARVPAGSIAIGGIQTSIGSIPAPSGWHLIGRTPVRCFLPEREPPFLFRAGHEVVFTSVPESQWDVMEAAAARGDLIAERIGL